MLLNPYVIGSGEPAPSTERTPAQLVFSSVLSQVLFDPQPLRAELTDFTELFASTGNLDVLPIKFGGVVGAASASAGVLTVADGTGTVVAEKTSVSSYGLPDVFVELSVTQQGSSGTLDIVQAGVLLDGNNFIVASIDRAGSLAWIQSTTSSDSTRIGQVSYTVPAGAFRLGMGMVMGRAGVYVDTGAGWQLITGGDVSAWAFNTPASLVGWRAGFCLASTAATTWKFNKLRSGRFGSVGFRDPTLMTNRDGSTYVESGKIFLTASTNLVAGGGEASRLTIHSVDMTTLAMENCGLFYVNRSGSFSPDINLHIVDNGDGTQELFWATWGTAPFAGGKLEVVHASVTGDFHVGAHLLTSWAALALPTPAGAHAGAYDAMLAFDGAAWTAAYAVVGDTTNFGAGFWPARASTSDLVSWSVVGSDQAGANTYEGVKLYRANGLLWELAGGPQGAGNKARIYNEAMSYQADLSATFSGGTDTQPHPMVFNYGDYAWLITFDNTRTDGVQFSWGKYIVQRSPRYV